MKKFAVLAVLAVLAVGGLSHKAMAWCKFNFSCGCNLCFEKGDSCTTLTFTKTQSGCPSPCCEGGGGYGYPADAYPHAYAAPAATSPTTPATPTFPPTPKPADTKPKTDNQPVGYWGAGYQYTPSPSTGYQFYSQGGYGSAPSYWYGR